jgi:hypothetical protein
MSEPLNKLAAPLFAELYLACSGALIQRNAVSDFAIVFDIGGISITCVRHLSESSLCRIMVSLNTNPVFIIEQEHTHDYIQRVVKLIQSQLHLLLLWRLVELLSSFDSLDIVKEDGNFKIDVKSHGFASEATIQRGSLVSCAIPLRTDGSYNGPLMAQLFMLIQPESAFKVRIFPTTNGFVGLYNEGDQTVLSFSNDKGISTRLDAKGITFDELEQFLKEPTDSLVVIHTTGQFDGIVGNLEILVSNSASIIVDGKRLCVDIDRLIFLRHILTL